MSHDQASAPISQGFVSWIVYLPSPFLDLGMSDQARVLLLRLESLSRNHPWCFPGNDYLARVLGKKFRAVHASLDELETKAWILRVYRDKSKRKRAGIVMRRRIDPLMPVATDETLDRVLFEVLDGRKLPSDKCRRVGWKKTSTEEPIDTTHFAITGAHDFLALSEDALMDACENERGAESPKVEECVESSADQWEAAEAARNLAAVARGVEALTLANASRSAQATTITALARIVSRSLIDDHSKAFHAGILWEVAKGQIQPQAYIDAFTETLAKPTERDNFGAYFNGAVRGKQHRRTDKEFAEQAAYERGEPL